MTTTAMGKALITGASTGIGAIYADRLARRGHDLIVVARNRERLAAVAKRVAAETGRSVEIVVANLNDSAQLAMVEQVLRTDTTITTLVNNAGIGAPTPFLAADIDQMATMIDLNVTALVRLTYAVLPKFVARGNGAIINISSVVGIAPEVLNSVYGGTKAFVLAFSLALQKQLADSAIRVQAVLPGATATEFWDLTGTAVAELPETIVMSAGDLVDAALAGFDQGEAVTIPALPDIADWKAYESARQHLMPNLSLSSPAARYGLAAA